jgi:ATP-dependent Lhr-like helicase
VLSRRWSDPASTDDMGALDVGAIEAVANEAWPRVRNEDEMQEALVQLASITHDEASTNEGWSGWLEALAAGGRATQLHIGSGAKLWVALERLACLQAAYPGSQSTPPLAIPERLALNGDEPWTRDAALVELLRARLSGFGPQPAAATASSLVLPESTVLIALTHLESEGYVMRGRFTPRAATEEWCERHLLARIHRYTIKNLRREIEPLERQDFMRFLFDWQHLSEDTRLQGPDSLQQVLSQLEGFEAPAGAWEGELLTARVKDYSLLWLDDLCRSGRIVWTRVGAPSSASGGTVRSTPLVLLPRRQLSLWHALPAVASEVELSHRATRVLDAMRRNGAMFYDELAHEARLLPAELETALGELVATGLVNADSYAGLRAMLIPANKRNTMDRRRRRGAGPTMEEAGRWALVRQSEGVTIRERPGNINGDADGAKEVAVVAQAAQPARRPRTAPETLEHIAMTLLRRYGVMFWKLLDREASWLPSWRELLPVYHRLEARGEVRGGRFVAGLSGEQFALPEAIPLLRDMRRRPHDGTLVAISAIDPLNLSGTVLSGDKVPALSGNRILFRDGVAVATQASGKFNYLQSPSPDEREQMHALLVAHR